jgi:hypothetical protein
LMGALLSYWLLMTSIITLRSGRRGTRHLPRGAQAEQR